MAFDVEASFGRKGRGEAWFGLDSTGRSEFSQFRDYIIVEAPVESEPFAVRTHPVYCCPCGEDHAREALAHKIAISIGGPATWFSSGLGAVESAPDGSPLLQTFTIPSEVAGDITTTQTIVVGDTVVSQIEISGDQDWFRIELQAGQTYQFTLTATGSPALGDPYLELMDASGNQVAFNDDGGGSLDSLLRFTATATGTYYLNAHGWINGSGQTSTGGYTLSTSVAPPIQPWTIDQIAAYLANGSSPGLGPRWTITNITYNIEDLTASERQLAERALQMWAAVTPLTFTRTTGSANITFVNSVADDPNAAADETDPVAYARTSTSGNSITSSRIVISSNWQTLDPNAQAGWFDNYMQQTYIHEIGHALGLGHGGPYDGSADYGTDNLYSNDHWAYTVMSYFDQLEAGHGNYRFVLGLQQADIAAMHLLYGTNPAGTFSGNTTFGFNSSAPGTNIDWSQFVYVDQIGTYRRPPSMTIYDTGGVDTINLSGFSQPQILDLTPGTFSSLGDRPNPSQFHYVNVVAIHFSTIIENAVGGSGNDRITGNSANNTITLGAGADVFVYAPNGGADTITDFSVAQDRLDLTAFSASAALTAFNGRTSSSGGTLLTFAAGQTILLQGVSVGQLTQANLILSAGSNAVFGTSSADRMDGTSGSDELHGLGGNDYILGYGGDDFLYGGDGDDTLDGGPGNDYLDGGAGDDVLYVTNGDTVLGGPGRDTVIVVDALGQGYVLDMGASSIERVQATSLADTIDASTATEWVQIYTGGGADIITGSAFGDVIHIVSAEATINAGGGRDTIVFDRFDGTGISVNLGAMNAESFISRNGNDFIDASTATDWVSIYTGGGVDTVIGSTFGDSIYLESTTVTVAAGAGRDWIIYNVFDGSGITVNLGAMQAEGFVGRGGNDFIDASTATDWVSIYTGGGVDTVIGSAFGDSIYLESTTVTVTAGAGRDWIVYNVFDGSGITVNLTAMQAEGFVGRGGNDSVTAAGTTVDVTLYGEGGNDTLIGGSGRDSIFGGAGNDTLSGGSGGDYFVFQGTWGLDTITDFEPGVDRLILRVAGLSNFAQLSISQAGPNTVITYGGQTIALNGILVANLNASHFTFEPSLAQEEPDSDAPLAEATTGTFDFSLLAAPLHKTDAPVMELPGAAENTFASPDAPITDPLFTELALTDSFDFDVRNNEMLNWQIA